MATEDSDHMELRRIWNYPCIPLQETDDDDDISSSPANWTPPLLGDDGGDFNISVICRSDDDIDRVVIKPMSENIIKAFFHDCVPDDSLQLSENWTLCGHRNSFECSDIQTYVKSCSEARVSVLTSCHNTRDHPVGLLVGLTVAGFLLGLITMAIICLLLPRLKRLFSKSKDDNQLANDRRVQISGNNRESTKSEQYIDIDQHGTTAVPMQPFVGYSRQETPSNIDMTHPVYHRISSEPEVEDTYTVPGEGSYEPLTRSNNKQSHKYAAIQRQEDNDKVTDGSGDGVEEEEQKQEGEEEEEEVEGEATDHSYFILQKKT